MLYLTLFLLTSCLVSIQAASLWQGLIEEEICETKECHDAAAHIKKWMNPAFNPCEDFFEFSCGYWHSPDTLNCTESKVNNMSIGSRGNIVSFHLKNILEDDEIVKESRLYMMLKQFLSLCLDEDTIEARGMSPAVEALRKVGGWPVLEQNWAEDKWNIENTKIAFGGNAIFEVGLGYGQNYTLKIEVMRPNYKIRSQLNLSEGIENESIKEYYMKGCELAEAFGADRSKAEAEMREAVEFEIAVAELINSLEEVRNSSEQYEDSEKTLPELQLDVPWVNWTYLLTNVLPQSIPITEGYIIEISDLELLNGLGNLIDNYPRRTVANFVMWKTARTLTQYLSANARNFSGEESPYKDRYEMCVAFIQRSSLMGATASYIAKKTEDDSKVVREMTENILNELLADVSELEWLDEKTRKTAIQTLRETKINVAFPEEATDVKVLEDIYSELKMDTSNFFEAVMDSNKWARKSNFEKVGGPIMVDRSLKDQMETALSVSAHFVPNENIIVVSAGFMHFTPLFSSKVPAYVNYGHLGGVIAHELTHALDFQTDGEDMDYSWMSGLDNSWLAGDNYKDMHVMERWGSNATEEIYHVKKQCIIDQYGSFKDTKYSGKRLNSNHTDREDVADNGGFKLALGAYRKAVANLVSPEPRLPTLQQYSPEQLFVLSTANTFCEIPTKEKLKSQIRWDVHSPFEFRVKGIMMNFPEFGELFNCKKSEPMNPEEKCEVW